MFYPKPQGGRTYLRNIYVVCCAAQKGATKIRRLAKWICTLVLLAAAVLVYAWQIEPRMLLVHRETVNGGGDYTVVQLADIELSEWYPADRLDRLVDTVNRQQPDAVVFTGDLFHNYAQYAPVDEVCRALGEIEAACKVAVYGNRDYGGGAFRVYEDVMAQAGFTVLKNSGVRVDGPGGGLWIGGLDDGLFGSPDAAAAMTGSEGCAVKLLAFHEPDLADEAAALSPTLMLAGHTHGGQVRLPFMRFGSTSMAERYYAGQHTVDGVPLYISGGLGMSRLPLRLLTPPSVTVFDIGV